MTGTETPRPNEGRDCRKEFARGFYLWTVTMLVGPFVGLYLGIWVDLWVNRLTGSDDPPPNFWGLLVFFVVGSTGEFIRFLQRCPACKDRLRLSDYRPKHCHCGALLNDRHQNGPWW